MPKAGEKIKRKSYLRIAIYSVFFSIFLVLLGQTTL